MSEPDENLRSKFQKVYQRLLDLYDEPTWRPHMDAIPELASTILSQNTNDENRDVAFERLRQRFPSWEQVRDADPNEVIEAIRPAGLANQKGPRLQEALRIITQERGELTLGFLRDLPLDEAKTWLQSIKGVGPKTAAIVLLFSLGRPAFPVDTHIHRVSQRLGLIGPRVSRERAHVELEELVPAEAYYAFHLNLIRHGRQVCQARAPRCPDCILRDLCEDYQRRSGFTS